MESPGKIRPHRRDTHAAGNEYQRVQSLPAAAYTQGVISGEERGYVRLLLPFFDQYILAHYDLF